MRQSTLLQMIAGLVGPSPAIVVDGRKSTDRPRARDGLSSRQCVPWMRVIDNVEYV